MTTTPRIRSLFVVGLCVAVALATAGCGFRLAEGGGGRPLGTPPAATPGSPAGPSYDDASPGDTNPDPFAEREQFFADQQQQPGDPLLSAKTDPQRELIAQQRAHVESLGGAWSPEIESITLALGLDACETSILNAHDIDLTVFRMHGATSPLIQSFATAPAELEGAVSIMVFGTRYLCPDDASQWESAWTEAAGEYGTPAG